MPHHHQAIRPMQAADLPAILAIQAECYPPELIESAETLARKQALAPHTSWVYQQGGRVCGYLFAHIWHGDNPPQWNTELAQLPEQADQLFLHDMAIARRARGSGIAGTLCQHALGWAQQAGLPRATLIAVRGAEKYWQKHGFVPHLPLPAEKRESYGEDAVMMVARVY